MEIRMSDVVLPGSLAAGEVRQGSLRSEGRGMHAREVRATIWRAVLMVVFAVLAVAALFYSIAQAGSAYALAQNYQAVQGRVVQTQCANHLQVGYAFEAGGAIYRGSGMAHRRCDAYRVGEPLAVYFAPGNPGVSLSEVTPLQEWHERLALVLTELTVLGVVGLMFGLRRGAA